MNSKQKKKIIIGGIVLLVGIIAVLLYLIFRSQEPQRVADVPLNMCAAESGKCSWSASGASSYEYKVIDTSTNTPLKQGTTTENQVTFTPEKGKTYRCEVVAKNECGSSPTGTGTGTCGDITPTPTTPDDTATPTPTMPEETPTPTPTATPTPTPLPVICNGVCNKNSECATPLICVTGKCRLPANPSSPTCELAPTPTVTPTPTLKPTATPVPTQPPVVVVPPQTINPPPPVVQQQPPVVNTPIPPRPTVAPTGSIATTLSIIGIAAFTILGGAILFIL